MRKPEVYLPETADDDPRLGQLMGGLLSEASAQLVIVGFPSDEGVRRNQGRPGAALAPARIRQFLYRLCADPACADEFGALMRRTADLGDLPATGDLENDQSRLAETLAPHLREGRIVLVLGGGHETAFGHFLAYARLGREIDILNWDAHLDVRPLRNGLGHSGSPFRQAITHPSGTCRSYRVAGMLPQCNATDHLEFALNYGLVLRAEEVSLDVIPSLYQSRRPLMVSFDFDALDQAFAPGVSAPSSGGLSPGLWLAAAFEAGRAESVHSIEFVEVNPLLDRDDQTSRLAALTIWHFLKGLAFRLRSA